MLPYLALTPALPAGEPAPILNIRSVQEVLNLRDTQSTAAITNLKPSSPPHYVDSNAHLSSVVSHSVADSVIGLGHQSHCQGSRDLSACVCHPYFTQ